MKTKRCPHCKKDLPEICFSLRKDRGGLDSWCRDCENEDNKARYHRNVVLARMTEPPPTKYKARRWAKLTAHYDQLPHDPYERAFHQPDPDA